MALGHNLPWIVGGVTAAVTTVAGAAYTLAADTSAGDIGPYITGGGAATSAAVLCLVAVKLTRGELVARDPARVEAAYQKLAEQAQSDHADVVAQWAQIATERERTFALIERAITAFNEGHKP